MSCVRQARVEYRRLRSCRFDDCLRLGRRIAEDPYLLPDPEILRRQPYDDINSDTKPDAQADAHRGTHTERVSSERQRLTVFEGKRLLLCSDLGIADHLHDAIQAIVETSKGVLVSDVSKADILICQYRDGSDYEHAWAQGMTIGNLAWFYHTVTQNTWTSPFRKLLHYPTGRDGIPGFERYRVSLSNYSGGARIYLENLAKAAGCEFSRTMKQTNTHLITAHPKSEKCAAARDWNVHIVNHLWLEESYANWQIQSVANPKYTCFPLRTNLGEVVGLTPINKAALVGSSLSGKPEDEPAGISSSLRADSEDDSLAETKPNTGVSTTTKTPLRSKVVQSVRTKASDTLTPARTPRHAEEKENESPPTTGRREAAEKAAARLHQLAPDIALYEKEKKRTGGGSFVFGGRPTAEETVPQKPHKKKPKRKAGDGDEAPRAKKTKTTAGSAAVRLLVTGHSKWTKDRALFQQEKVGHVVLA